MSETNDWWIPHDGGDCPDAVMAASREGKCIVMQFRDNSTEPTYSPYLWRWTATQELNDVVAYRIVQPSMPMNQKQEDSDSNLDQRFKIRAADRLAYCVAKCIERGDLGSRSGAADALLDYLQIGQSDGFNSVPDWVNWYENKIKR